jgi:hypothetical protein
MAAVATEAALQPLPTYHEPSVKQKVREWRSDLPWMVFDRRYKTTIAHERKKRRVAGRILVARIAAGVDKPPVWGKHKVALALAEKALNER